MLTRPSTMPWIYVIGSPQQLNHAIDSLPRQIIEDIVPHCVFMNITSFIHENRLKAPIDETLSNNYLIILMPEYNNVKIDTEFVKIYPAQNQENNVSPDGTPGKEKTVAATPNKLFKNAFEDIFKIELEKESTRDTFIKKYQQHKTQSWTPAFFRKTRINKASSIQDIIQNAFHEPSYKSSSDSKQVLMALGWITENNEPTDITPDSFKKAIAIEQEQRSKKTDRPSFNQ